MHPHPLLLRWPDLPHALPGFWHTAVCVWVQVPHILHPHGKVRHEVLLHTAHWGCCEPRLALRPCMTEAKTEIGAA